MLRSQERLREGSSHYHRCLERWLHKRSLLLNAINCWRETGESAAALRWLRLARKEPDDLQLAEALAEALALNGKKTEAIGQYELCTNQS